MNERKWVESILDDGYLGKKPWPAIYAMARYFYQVEGLRKKGIMARLQSILTQIMPGYNRFLMEPTLERAATRAKRRSLIEIDTIAVSQTEMAKIKELPTPRLQRLMFTMVCLAKYFNIINPNNNGWINQDPSDVYRMACITSLSMTQQAGMYRDLIDLGYIEYAKKVANNNCKVLILDDGEPELEVHNLDKVGYEYLLYCGENYVRCKRCGLLFRPAKADAGDICKECGKIIPVAMRRYNCIDCGREVFVVSRNHRSCRCVECQQKANLLKHQRYNSKREKT